MFKKSTTNKQLGLFTTASSLMCKRESKQYEDEKAWHMQFYRNVTCNIDEDVFRPLFDEKMGCPTKAIRQLVAMSILKEGAGCSDETLYENCRYNLLWRAALGLFNIDDQCPAISSYYRLRELICDYEETSENHENLYEKCFQKLTAAQCKAYKVSGKTVRMDSKLISSNIAWYSRYEIIHKTLLRSVDKGVASRISDQLVRLKAEEFLDEDASKTVYRSDSETLGRRLLDLGIVISHILKVHA